MLIYFEFIFNILEFGGDLLEGYIFNKLLLSFDVLSMNLKYVDIIVEIV